MKTKNIFAVAQALLVFILFALVAGCDKKDNLTGAEITETNLFPPVVGHLYVYSGYDLDTTSSQKIPNTVHRQATVVQGTTTLGGKTAYRLIDSIYTPSGSLSMLDTTYVNNENGDLLVYQSGTWQTFFKKSAGVNVEYEIGQQMEMSPIGPISVPLKGKIYPKASIALPYGTVDAYKLEIKASINFSGISFEVVQYIYFSDGIGPVQFTNAVMKDPFSGRKSNGNEQVLVSKNF
ncbi:MAG: hypothetical protein HY088_06260 [Ignavibacteriales bacterium]|nr:hypothetical protein [Ignavibacteriales bacterium]